LSACRFQFEFSGSSTALVEAIRAKMDDAGGQFEGSPSIGRFVLPTPVGAFEGTYTVDESTIWVEVNEKPFFVPCSAIEAKLREIVKTRS
jgi:hypothetical protein